uniref:Uncharacterized protein n=1 Tax=Schlesneria paludicola TaxID=360056 RepID=A0A7C4QTQ0_9PLAN
MSCRVRVEVCWGLLALMGICGCRPEEEITQYTIPKFESIQLPPPEGKTAPAPRAERLLGAIVPRGEQTWFFKLSGAPERVAACEEPFTRFLQSVQFSPQGAPEWTLPEGWTQEPGSGMRFATLIVDPREPPLELTVIALPTADSDLTEQVLANVNRWRGQLQLPPLTKDDLPRETKTLRLPGNETATIADFQGTTKPNNMMAPFAAGTGLSRPSAAAAGSSAPPFTASPPAEWSPGRTSSLRKAAYVVPVPGSERGVEITVIDLAREAGDRLANVNRWREQVGLDPIDQAQWAASREHLEIDGIPADLVELVGPKQETILGAIADRGERTWFFKLHGPSAAAANEKPRFLEYLRSVRWK